MRRVRVHQAWYRANVLGLARYGSLAGSKDLCGSVLVDEDAERWLNFLGPSAAATYAARRASWLGRGSCSVHEVPDLKPDVDVQYAVRGCATTEGVGSALWRHARAS